MQEIIKLYQMCHRFLFIVTHPLHMGSFQCLSTLFVVFWSPLHGMNIPFKPDSCGGLSIKARPSFPSKRCWIVFSFRTFWCDQDRLPHCSSGRLGACSSLLCQIRLENGCISSLSKDNKDGKLPRKALFSQGADLLGSHRWYSRFWGSHCSAVKQESWLWG